MDIRLKVEDGYGMRIDAWLASYRKEYSRTFYKKLIDGSKVIVNGSVIKSSYRVKPDDVILLDVPAPEKLAVEPEDIPIDIVYEDDHILVVEKPKGMVVHPAPGHYTGTLVNALMECCGDRLSDINGIIRPGIVHRLDKDTSGLLIVAKNNQVHEKLSSMLKDHLIKRIYAAVVKGVLNTDRGEIIAPIGRNPVNRKKMAVNTVAGRRAVTHFDVIERYEGSTYIEARLETGRTHQIRVHMAYIGHPVLGDPVYGGKFKGFDLSGQALHARSISFRHPVTQESMQFDSQLPEYFKRLLDYCRLM